MNWSEYQPYDQAQQLRELVRQERAAATALPPLSPEREKRTRVITVTSGKGGVGKTNLVANLGIALASEGLRVGLFDADLGLANIDVLLGLVPRYSLAHVLSGERQIEEIMVPGPGGVMILAGASGMSSLADVPPESLHRLIQSMDRLDGLLDICLVDTGAGIGRQVMSFVLVAEEVVVVTTPEPTAVTDAYGLIKTLKLNRSSAGIFLVVNMVEGPVEGQEIFHRLQTVSQR
ncbi:MAG: MinD/ParA family protein, partial [Bacillota bacterium]|nr:MinD/ParA family protein [Bacillota bacterium]